MLRKDPMKCDVELCSLMDHCEHMEVPVACLGNLWKLRRSLDRARHWHRLGHMELSEAFLSDALVSAMWVRIGMYRAERS